MRVVLMILCLAMCGCDRSEKTPVADLVRRAELEEQKQKVVELESNLEELEAKVKYLEADAGDTADEENLPQRVAAIEANEANHGW